jgi:FkbM family methyltransferase
MTGEGRVARLRSSVARLLRGAGPRRRAALRRELRRLRTAPRRTLLTTDLLGVPMRLSDGLSFWGSYRDIFERRRYEFRTAAPRPYVVDGGANVGLSVLYFKRLYPAADVVAFEADPAIHALLAENVRAFGLTDVTLVAKALWDADTELEFVAEGSDGGRIRRGQQETIARTIRVPAVRLRPWLGRPVDLLKLDIEGAETAVLLDCEDLLPNVVALFVEYHSFAHEEQRLDELLGVLRRAGFRVQVHTQFASPRPFLERPDQLGMDLQLNVFGTRI